MLYVWWCVSSLVVFADGGSAQRALQELNGAELDGRRLYLREVGLSPSLSPSPSLSLSIRILVLSVYRKTGKVSFTCSCNKLAVRWWLWVTVWSVVEESHGYF